MTSLVSGLPEFGSRGHRTDRRSRRLISRLMALGAAGALAVALMPGATLGAAAAPAVALMPATPAAPVQPATVAGDWSQFRNGPTHQGYNPSETTISASNVDALAVTWRATTGSAINSSPAVADGVVYVGSNDFKLYAYAVGCASGGGPCSPLWSSVAAGGVVYSAPAVANGVVYVGSMDGKLYAYAVGCASGGGSCSPLWTGATGSYITSSPAVANGVVYVGSDDGTLYAFDAAGLTGCSGGPKTCTPLWTAAAGTGIFSSPAVASGVLYVGSYDNKLYAFDAAGGDANCTGSAPTRTCTPLWTATTGSSDSSPAVANGVVYVGAGPYLWAFDAAGATGCSGSVPSRTCTPLWKGATGSFTMSSPAVANGVVYVGSNDHKLYAFDAAGATGCSGSVPNRTCPPLWTATTGDIVYSSPAVANGVVYVGSDDHKLYAYAVGCNSGGLSCSPLWTATTGGIVHSSPAVANGVVYVGSADHNLYAYAVTGDWPQFHNSPSRQGYNSAEHVLSPANVGALGVKWTGGTGGAISSSPAVANGVVYVGSNDGSLYAYAVGCASGGGSCPALWTAATGSFINSSPAVANGVVYVGSGDNKLYAYAVGCNSGGGPCTPLWTGATGGAIWSSPAIANGVVYVGSWDNKLYAFDAAGVTGCSGTPKTCTPLWTGATGGAIWSSPAIANGVVYVGSADNKLYAYAVGCNSGGGTCSPLWTAATGGAVASTPAVANGVVYVGSEDSKLYAFDAAGLTRCGLGICLPLWTATTGSYIDSSPAVANGVVYVGSSDHKLYAYAVGCSSGGGSCSPLWTGATGGAVVFSSPAVANGVVYIGSEDHKAYAYAVGCRSDGGACSPLWTATTGDMVYSSPAVVNGVVYVGSNDNSLYAFVLNPLDHLVLSPASATIAAGGSRTYTAGGFDAGSHSLGDFTSATTFTIGAGGSCTGASCTSTVAGDHTVTGTDGSATGTATLHVSPAPTTGDTYHPMTPPVRLLDTRVGNGLSGKILANTPATFQITGRGGIPSNAAAVTGNVTVVNSSFSWAVYLGPDPIASPSTSTINFASGEVAGNGLTVALGGTGSLSATYISTAGNTTDLVFDVTGYFTPDASGATYHAMTPARLLDTRVGNGLSGKLLANTPATFQVTGRGGIPGNAIAVTGNVTVVNSTFSWAISLGPVPTASPTTSTINFDTGQVKGNNLTVALGGGGTLSATYMSNAGNNTDLVFDVTGYYTADLTGATFVPIDPVRMLDTRVGNGLGSKISANTPATFGVAGRPGVPSNAVAVTGNVTVVNETFSWAVFLGPDPIASPPTSTINFNLGDIKGNGLTVALGSGGTLSATYMSTAGNKTDLVFDVTGYYVAAP